MMSFPIYVHLDPSPDVRAMLLEFDDMFFGGKLSGVEIKWSVCSYEGRGGLCFIRLSEPLLKLRPLCDLAQTLLHEIIHALLFFCKHMERINQAAGTEIAVSYWISTCDGPCQTCKPYFGYVKRVMNRAPSAQDTLWGDHLRSCGGTYTKTDNSRGKTDTSKDKKPTDKPTSKCKASSTSTAAHGSFRGQKPPKNVSKTKAFLNINGSPARVHKPNSTVTKPHSDSSDALKTKQTFVQGLVNASGWKSGTAASTSTSTCLNQQLRPKGHLHLWVV
uniref:SprT-like domain-containing protein n=1 Tax=Oncorhynchus tshawytscha TaxID=74940 RepID=A0A8C8GSL5_ONCTS